MGTPHVVPRSDRLSERAGIEAEVVDRLTDGIEPAPMRRVLVRCLAGELSPQMALAELLVQTENVTTVRFLVDDVTARADADSRSGDNLVRDRADELTRLFVENEAGCQRVAEMLREDGSSDIPGASLDDRIAFVERLFDWSVARNEEASAAFHSLGSAELLDAATTEVVDLLDRWELLDTNRSVLQIGCGIGRIERAIASRVREAHGVDVSTEAIRVATRRCAGLANVHFTKTSGRDLALYGDDSFDLVYAVDTAPYLLRAGEELLEGYVREARRVLRPGGELLVLNVSRDRGIEMDRELMNRLARAHDFAVLVNGDRPFGLWDAPVFRLRAGASSVER